MTSDYICARPWLAANAPLADTNKVSANGCPRLVLRAGMSPRWDSPAGVGVPASFPFLDGTGNACQSWFIPCLDWHHEGLQEIKLRWSCGEKTGEITQTELVFRSDEANPASAALAQLLHRLIRAFQELAHGERSPKTSRENTLDLGIPGEEFSEKGFSCRHWAAANAVWLKPEGCEPLMSLIVKLALDPLVRETTASIACNPRQILSRIREETRLNQITEMDAACMINYAKRPGRTAIEKAGVSQRLLSIQRIPNQNTLENQTARWVLEELEKRGRQWIREHAALLSAGKSSRARAVERMAHHARTCLLGSAMRQISSQGLHHPVQANYPLQMDQRYRVIMRLYTELRRANRVEDDAWIWQRPLWADAARQLMACALQDNRPPFPSLPYYRQEQDRGQWLLAGSAPGPISSQYGDAHWIDSRDALANDWLSLAPTDWLKVVGRLGPEWLLWRPASASALLVWPMLSTAATSSTDWTSTLREAEESLYAFQKNTAPGTRFSGLIIGVQRAETVRLVKSVHSAENGPRMAILLMPMPLDPSDAEGYQRIISAFYSGLQYALNL